MVDEARAAASRISALVRTQKRQAQQLTEVAFHLVLGVLLGAVAGSFAATILIRWPQGRAVSGRSACDSCAARLAIVDLVPVLSHLALRGRCRRCGGRIDRRHLAVELAGALIGAVAFLAHPFPLALIGATLGWWLLLIACLDHEHHWLPDALTLPLIPAGLAAGWLHVGPAFDDRAIGAVAGGGTLWLIAKIYRAARKGEGLGAGDPKLFAGLGAWLGWMPLPFLLLGAGILGIAAIMLAAIRGAEVGRSTRLPFGTLLAIAAWPLWMLVSLGGFDLDHQDDGLRVSSQRYERSLRLVTTYARPRQFFDD